MPQTVFVTPPPALLRDCPQPIFHAKTNGDLLLYTLDLSERLDQCNQDKKMLRTFIQKSQQLTGGKTAPTR